MTHTHVVRRCTSEEKIVAALDEQAEAGRRPIIITANATAVWMVFASKSPQERVKHEAIRCTSAAQLEEWLNGRTAEGYSLISVVANDTVTWAIAKKAL